MTENYKIGNLEVSSPWGNAGGVAKTIEEVEMLASTSAGWIEAGSYTFELRAGNGSLEDTYFHNSLTGETFNSRGKANKGIDIVEKEIPSMREIAHLAGKRLLVNVAAISEDPLTELEELVPRAYEAGADAVLIAEAQNVFNEKGQSQQIVSNNEQAFKKLIDGLSGIVDKYRPVMIRTSPFENYAKARSVLRSISSDVVSAVFVSNTWPVKIPVDKNEEKIIKIQGNTCGKSGPAMAGEAFKQTAWALSALRSGGRKIDVVSSSGIINGRELKKRLRLGAVAGAGTTLYYETPPEEWPEVTDRVLRELAEE